MSSKVDIDGSAERLDTKLRALARALDWNWGAIVSVIAEAKAREIHKGLGFKSWPEYIADVAGKEMPNVSRSVEQRRQVVALLAGEGMSQRAIADTVGVSQSTVRDDFAEVSRNYSPEPVDLDEQMRLDVTPEPATVTGRDGKTYPKPKPQERQPKRSNTFVDRFDRVLSQLQSDALRLQLLTKEEEFAENINELRRQNLNSVEWAQDIVAEVQNIIAGVLAQIRNQGELFGSANDDEPPF